MFVVSATPLSLLKLGVCFLHDMICESLQRFYATNENIHVLSMKFPHLFLRPEIIITFFGMRVEWGGGGGGGGGGWGVGGGGGQVRHRSPRNSGI